jgi:hypothetical protein
MPIDINKQIKLIEDEIRQNPFIALPEPAKNLRDAWISGQEKKAPRRKNTVTTKPSRGTIAAIRNKNIALREAVRRKTPRQVIITYTKTTTKETKKYICAPYSFRMRRLRVGWRKMLYLWDMEEKRTKSFAMRNIRKVAITDRVFVPKWPIEI